MQRAFLTLILLCSVIHSTFAQTPKTETPSQKTADSQDEVVKITTNLVQIDAVVLKDGKVVTDLRQEDFEIFEDGRRQQITSFAYISNVSGNRPPATPVAKTPDTLITPAQPIRPNAPGRTMALVVDDLGLSFESSVRLRNRLRTFLDEQIGPNDLVAVIKTGGTVGPLQQFTNDKRALHKAVDQIVYNNCSRVGVSTFSSLGNFNISLCAASPDVSLGVLGYIVESMGYLPGRKSLIFFSDSVPIQEQEFNFSAGGVDSTSLANSSDTNARTFDTSNNYYGQLKLVAERAIRSSVVIYTVDVKGLVYNGLSAADSINASSVREHITKTNTAVKLRTDLLNRQRDGADLIARQTGGFLVANSNSMQLDRIMEDQAGYYLIGYRPTDETFDKSFHKIKARVKKSGMTVRTRFGFYGLSEREAEKAKPLITDKMMLALVSPFGTQEIPLDMTAYFAYNPVKGAVIRSVINLNPKDLAFKESPDGTRVATVEFRTMIFGGNGQIVDQVTAGKAISLSAAKYQQALQEGVSVALETPIKRPGAYQFRVAARDMETSKMGASGQFVSVPDIKSGRLAISGLVIQPADNNLTLNPIVKRFVAGTNIRFGLEIYNASRDDKGALNITMQARLFHEDRALFTSPNIPVKAANQSELANLLATGTLQLSSTLEPGPYALQVTVTDNNAKEKPSVMQWVNFEVVK